METNERLLVDLIKILRKILDTVAFWFCFFTYFVDFGITRCLDIVAQSILSRSALATSNFSNGLPH